MPSRDEKTPKAGDTEKSSVGTPEIKVFYDLMVQEGLEFLEVKDEDFRLRLSRQPADIPAPPVTLRRAVSTPAQMPSSKPKAVEGQLTIASPLAGVFYRSSSPSAAVFVKEGDMADAGQTLCIVEAMKVMNEIKADKRCKIVQIVAENSHAVTAGQVLFMAETA